MPSNNHERFLDNVEEWIRSNNDSMHPALEETLKQRRMMNEDEWITGIEQALVPASYLDFIIDELDPNYRALVEEDGIPRDLVRQLVQLELIIILIDIYTRYNHKFVATFLRIMANKLETNGIGIDPDYLERMADSLSAEIDVPDDISTLTEGETQ